jgi:hypothetical protein
MPAFCPSRPKSATGILTKYIVKLRHCLKGRGAAVDIVVFFFWARMQLATIR